MTYKPRKADEYNDDSDSEGTQELQKASRAFKEKKGDAEERKRLQELQERFKTSVPGR